MEKRIWLITGISSGLGEALAKRVIESGDFVIGTFRNQSQVDTFIEENKSNATAYKLDITDKHNVSQVLDDVFSQFGRIDVLVNNAGVGFVGAIEEASTSEVRAVFEANFFGALNMTQKVLPYMRAAKAGDIIQISSHGGIKAFPGFGVYNASKFALEGFSEALAQEVEALGVRVSIVEPGPFRTNFASTGLGEAAQVIDDYADTAGAFRTKLKSVHGKQEGDPRKAAIAIVNLVNSENPPLRLPLGKIALATIGMKLESIKTDIENNRSIAEQVIF